MDPQLIQALLQWGLNQTAVDQIAQFFANEKISPDDQVKTLYFMTHSARASDVQVNVVSAIQDAHWQIMSDSQKAQYPQPKSGGSFLWPFAATFAGTSDLLGAIGAPFSPPQDPNFKGTRGLGPLQKYLNVTPQGNPDPSPFIDQSFAQIVQNQQAKQSSMAGLAPDQITTPNQPPTVGGFPQAWTMPDFSTQDASDFKSITGADAQAAYQQYVQGLTDTGMGRTMRPLPYDQWLKNNIQTSYGPAMHALDILTVLFNQRYGDDMPDDLRQQILKALLAPEHSYATAVLAMALDQAKQNATSDAAASQGSKTSGGVTATSAAVGGNYQTVLDVFGAGQLLDKYAPWLNQDIIQPYVLTFPTANALKANQDTKISNQFQTKLGRAPTPADIKALEGKSDTEISNYIDSQTINNGSGMQYGSYNTAYNRIAPDWQRYLQKQPTPDQVARFASMSDAELNAWIDKQPSHVPGMPVGQYESYSKTVDQVANQYYGYTSTDFLNGLLSAMGKK